MGTLFVKAGEAGQWEGGTCAHAAAGQMDGTQLARLVGSAQHLSAAAENKLGKFTPVRAAAVLTPESKRLFGWHIWQGHWPAWRTRRCLYSQPAANGWPLHLQAQIAPCMLGCADMHGTDNNRPAGLSPWLLLAGRLCRLLACRPKLRQLSLPLLSLLCPLALQRRRSKRKLCRAVGWARHRLATQRAHTLWDTPHAAA